MHRDKDTRNDAGCEREAMEEIKEGWETQSRRETDEGVDEVALKRLPRAHMNPLWKHKLIIKKTKGEAQQRANAHRSPAE